MEMTGIVSNATPRSASATARSLNKGFIAYLPIDSVQTSIGRNVNSGPRLCQWLYWREMQAHSPPCEGGVAAASIKSREATEAPQTGWSLTRNVSKRIFETSLVSDHPVRAVSEWDHFLMARTPLLHKEGKMLAAIHSHLHTAATVSSIVYNHGGMKLAIL